MKFKKILFLCSLFSLFGFSWPFSNLVDHANPETFVSTSMAAEAPSSQVWLSRETQIIESETNINPSVLHLSLIAYMNARKRGLDNKQLLTVIDYSKPSTDKRLWVFDIRNGRTLFNTWVSHGKNSGDIYATSFSNSNGSLKSSLGVFVTDAPYVGGDGYSLRLSGLEQGFNSNAYNRDVVIHGAAYVNPDTIRRYGRIGRSWGCPAVSTDLAKPIIDTIKDNTVVFAYYPDRNWLSHSAFLAG